MRAENCEGIAVCGSDNRLDRGPIDRRWSGLARRLWRLGNALRANEVPARNTPATGTAGLTFDGTTVRYSVKVDDLSRTFMGHIHSAAAGTNGPIRVWLWPSTTPGQGPEVSFTDKTVIAEGSFTAANVTGISFDALLNEMRSGNCYVNFHSTTYPGGEIRGQVRLVDVD